MKYLILALALFMVGCSDDSQDRKILDLEGKVANLTYHLQACQSSLDVYRNPNTSIQESAQKLEETKAEPSCEQEYSYEIYVNGKFLVSSSHEIDQESCGVNIKEADDDANYYCLQNVKIKTVTKEICN